MILSWVIVCLLAFLLSILFFIVYIDVDTPIIIVSGSSMRPTLSPGDLVLVSNVPINELNVGDIIVYKSYDSLYNKTSNKSDLINPNEVLVIHRVINITRDNNNFIFLTTRGDNNFSNDTKPVTESNYVGKVYFVIPRLGSIITLFKEPVVIAIIIIVTIISYLYYR